MRKITMQLLNMLLILTLLIGCSTAYADDIDISIAPGDTISATAEAIEAAEAYADMLESAIRAHNSREHAKWQAILNSSVPIDSEIIVPNAALLTKIIAKTHDSEVDTAGIMTIRSYAKVRYYDQTPKTFYDCIDAYQLAISAGVNSNLECETRDYTTRIIDSRRTLVVNYVSKITGTVSMMGVSVNVNAPLETTVEFHRDLL